MARRRQRDRGVRPPVRRKWRHVPRHRGRDHDGRRERCRPRPRDRDRDRDKKTIDSPYAHIFHFLDDLVSEAWVVNYDQAASVAFWQ
jgi:hypothetical protein